ncbi:MAG: S8 family peptidase [Bacteroidota bacterium]
MKNRYPTKSLWIVALFALLAIPFSNAQTILYEENFTTPVTAPGWTWSPDGTASNGQFWNDRPAIFSESGGGALMVNADSIIQSGQPFVEAFYGFTYHFQNFSPTSRYYLKFNQYYRNSHSQSLVEASIGEFLTQPIFNNNDILENVETSHKDVITLDITENILGDSVFIQFLFFGDYYFWIIDDIQIIEDNNSYPPQTVWGNVPGEGDFNGGLHDWTTIGISDPNALWVWESDGKADQGAFAGPFGDQPILSPSLSNGAMVFDSDFYDNGGDDQNLGNGPVPALQISELISPIIDLSGMPASNILLTFNQYFRQQNSVTSVAFSSDGGNNWSPPIMINQNVPPGDATPAYEQLRIPLSGAIPTNQFRIKFTIEADYFFWIIDDVKLGVNTLYPETFPPYIGDSLLTYGIPYDVDCDKGPYVPNQLVVQFSPSATPMYKDSIRNSFGVAHVDTCMCSVVELWHFGQDTAAMGGLSGSGPSVGITEKKASAKSTADVDGVDFNRFVWNELQGAPPPVFTQLQAPPPIPGGPHDVLIAILDTGLDFDHPDLVPLIYRNFQEDIDSLDEDGSCLIDDVVGYNFVKDNNNVQDDHSHGTHLAGIIKNNLEVNNACGNYKLLPIKTHNENGVAELFDIVCGFYYALQQGADVINCSWGWYDNDSDILNNFLDSARNNYNAIAIAAAGNDTIDLQEHPQFPACNAGNNVISVGAIGMSMSGDTLISPFSNFSTDCIDIAAPGEDINSTLPGGTMGLKSGTSMAAPVVAAIAAEVYCAGNIDDYLDIRNCIIDAAVEVEGLNTFVENGNFINFNLPCVITSIEGFPDEVFTLKVFPNPTSGELQLAPDFNLENATIAVRDLLGNTLYAKHGVSIGEGQSRTISLADFVPGIYLVSVQVGQEVRTIKVVKH